MSFDHVIVWLDHAQAHVIHFTPETAANEIIKTHSTHTKSEKEGGGHRAEGGNGRRAESKPYFNDIANALQGALEILIVGPGNEKLAFLKYLLKHQHDLAEQVISLETVDHPTDLQLLAYARKYFVGADRLSRSTPGVSHVL